VGGRTVGGVPKRLYLTRGDHMETLLSITEELFIPGALQESVHITMQLKIY
jgi:hypothetical protein